MSVIEYPKDKSEPQGGEHPYLQRDTINFYLITSRDGIHIDDEWVYAHRPLLPKEGKRQGGLGRRPALTIRSAPHDGNGAPRVL